MAWRRDAGCAVLLAGLLAGGTIVSARGSPAVSGKGAAAMKVVSRKVLSRRGSTRATAYSMSNKIVTRDGRIFVAWLDFVSEIRVAVFDVAAGEWSDPVEVGRGVDNHSGPALTLDGNGFLHIVYGPHHHPFRYRRSARPLEIGEWTPEETFAAKATYPSLVAAPDGRLWCACRSSRTDPWRLRLYRRAAGGRWDEGVDLLDVAARGYAWLGNSLAVGPDGTVHLAFVIYDSEAGRGRACGYLRTRDGGRTWETAGGNGVNLPVTPASGCFVEQDPALDMRVGNVVLDPRGNPWFSATHLERSPRTVLLWHHDGTKWTSEDPGPSLRKALPGREIVDATVTFDAAGTLYVACTVQEELPPGVRWWGHPSQEVVLLTSADRGRSFRVLPVSPPDPGAPNWLPSIERPFSARPLEGIPSLLYTHGGPGTGSNTEGPPTEVVFVRFGTDGNRP